LGEPVRAGCISVVQEPERRGRIPGALGAHIRFLGPDRRAALPCRCRDRAMPPAMAARCTSCRNCPADRLEHSGRWRWAPCALKCWWCTQPLVAARALGIHRWIGPGVELWRRQFDPQSGLGSAGRLRGGAIATSAWAKLDRRPEQKQAVLGESGCLSGGAVPDVSGRPLWFNGLADHAVRGGGLCRLEAAGCGAVCGVCRCAGPMARCSGRAPRLAERLAQDFFEGAVRIAGEDAAAAVRSKDARLKPPFPYLAEQSPPAHPRRPCPSPVLAAWPCCWPLRTSTDGPGRRCGFSLPPLPPKRGA